MRTELHSLCYITLNCEVDGQELVPPWVPHALTGNTCTGDGQTLLPPWLSQALTANTRTGDGQELVPSWLSQTLRPHTSHVTFAGVTSAMLSHSTHTHSNSVLSVHLYTWTKTCLSSPHDINIPSENSKNIIILFYQLNSSFTSLLQQLESVAGGAKTECFHTFRRPHNSHPRAALTTWHSSLSLPLLYF